MTAPKIGEILIELGAVGPEDVTRALQAQEQGDPRRLGELLIEAGVLTPLVLAQALSRQSGLPLAHLDQVSPQVAALVPPPLQREHGLVAFKEEGPGKAIHAAVADPAVRPAVEAFARQLGREVKLFIAAQDDIDGVHAALGGDLVHAVIVEDPPQTSPPVAPSRSPQRLGRIALKRVAVSAGGVMSDVPRDQRPTVEMSVVWPSAESPPVLAPTLKPTVEMELPMPSGAHPTAESAAEIEVEVSLSGLTAIPDSASASMEALLKSRTDPEFAAFSNQASTAAPRADSLEFIPPAETVPRPPSPHLPAAPRSVDAAELVPPSVSPLVPSEPNRSPQRAGVRPRPSPPPPAPVDGQRNGLAPAPSAPLPSWVSQLPSGEDADVLKVALERAGATAGLVRVLRLLVKRGVVSEAELLEELTRK